jgi:signal transduction histidine kinase
VQVSGDRSAVLVYDITDWENQEHQVLFVMVMGIVLVLLIAIFSAIKASAAVLSPLRRLTSQITDIQPQQRGIRLSSEFSSNEVGLIAQAVNGYLERLDGFVAREKYFTTAASHELRTPLSVVTGAVEVLETHFVNTSTDSAPSRAIARIKRACHDMLGFIEVSLLLTREETQPLQSSDSTDVCELVSHLIDELQPQLQERRIRVLLDAKTALHLAQPRTLMHIVFSNLLRNAIEHTADGEIKVEINSDSLTVSDTGSGISPEHMQRVFEHSFTTKPNGNGVGLNLVQRLCERLRWQIDLQSRLGNGTSVRLVFQRA